MKGSKRKRRVIFIHWEHREMGQISTLDLCCRFPNHAGSQINPDYLAVRTNCFRCRKEIGTSSSADLQHLRAFCHSKTFSEMAPRVGDDARPYVTIGGSYAMSQPGNLLFLGVVPAHDNPCLCHAFSQSSY